MTKDVSAKKRKNIKHKNKERLPSVTEFGAAGVAGRTEGREAGGAGTTSGPSGNTYSVPLRSKGEQRGETNNTTASLLECARMQTITMRQNERDWPAHPNRCQAMVERSSLTLAVGVCGASSSLECVASD